MPFQRMSIYVILIERMLAVCALGHCCPPPEVSAGLTLHVYRRKTTMKDSSLSPSSRLGGAVISDRVVAALLQELRTGRYADATACLRR